MKQTAVEWLEIQLFNKQGKFTKADIEQAKAMEKEQIKDAWDDGAYGCGQFTTTHDNSEQYYKETFKQD